MTTFILFADSPLLLAISSIVCTFIAIIVNTFPNRKLIGYTYVYQFMDIVPNLMCSILMAIVVYSMNNLLFPTTILLICQVITGFVIYVIFSVATKNVSFKYLLSLVKHYKTSIKR